MTSFSHSLRIWKALKHGYLLTKLDSDNLFLVILLEVWESVQKIYSCELVLKVLCNCTLRYLKILTTLNCQPINIATLKLCGSFATVEMEYLESLFYFGSTFSTQLVMQYLKFALYYGRSISSCYNIVILILSSVIMQSLMELFKAIPFVLLNQFQPFHPIVSFFFVFFCWYILHILENRRSHLPSTLEVRCFLGFRNIQKWQELDLASTKVI